MSMRLLGLFIFWLATSSGAGTLPLEPAKQSVNCELVARLAASMRSGDLNVVDALSNQANERELAVAVVYLLTRPPAMRPWAMEMHGPGECQSMTGQE